MKTAIGRWSVVAALFVGAGFGSMAATAAGCGTAKASPAAPVTAQCQMMTFDGATASYAIAPAPGMSAAEIAASVTAVGNWGNPQPTFVSPTSTTVVRAQQAQVIAGDELAIASCVGLAAFVSSGVPTLESVTFTFH